MPINWSLKPVEGYIYNLAGDLSPLSSWSCLFDCIEQMDCTRPSKALKVILVASDEIALLPIFTYTDLVLPLSLMINVDQLVSKADKEGYNRNSASD